MAQTLPVRAVGGAIAVIIPLLVWGAFVAAPVLGQEDADIKIQTQTTPDVRETQPHPPAADRDTAQADVDVQRDAEGEDRELKVDFDAKGFADVLAVIRQMRMEIVQLRRELAEARGDRPLAERRLGYRQDGDVRNGERVENRIDNRQSRRELRIENRGQRRDQRTDNRDLRQEDRRDGDRIENRGERRDNREERRDDRQDDREERRDDRRDNDAEARPDQQ